MPINFPDSPTNGQKFEVDGRVWQYDGAVWEFIGFPGPVNELNIGTVTTGAAGTNASATISGDPPVQILNLTIPRGDVPTITLGTVSTGEPGTNVIITNSGTATGAIFNFTIPRGEDGALLIDDLNDVVISGVPSDNSLLAYDTATSKWINQTASQAGVAALSGATFTGEVRANGLVATRVNTSEEGGQIDLRRASDDALAWSIDVYGNTSTPDLRFIQGGTTNVASFNGSGQLTATPAPGTTSSAATGVGYMGIPTNGNNSGAYELVIGDAGEHIYTTSSRTITIPANSSVPFPVGTTIVFISGAGATTTIAISSDTLLLAGLGSTGSRTLAAHGMATAVKVDSTTWYISGNGLT